MASICVQQQRFDVGAEIERLAAAWPVAGAVASFVGYVRDAAEQGAVTALELEHYPGMTEKALTAIVDDAMRRWPLFDVSVIHRVGLLPLQEPIVLVAVASAHRQDAFEACACIMDRLKTEAPFWKKEYRNGSAHWVDARDSDQHAAERWTA